MRVLKGHSKYTPPSLGKSNLDTLKKLTCVHVIQTVLASERDTLRSVQLRIVDIYIYYSTCNMCKFCSYNP